MEFSLGFDGDEDDEDDHEITMILLTSDVHESDDHDTDDLDPMQHERAICKKGSCCT